MVGRDSERMIHYSSEKFLDKLDMLKELHLRKSADYGSTNDPFANIRASSEFGVAPWIGAMTRANDKVKRLQVFAQNGSLVNESAEDSLLDLASYSIIALILLEEESTQG